MSKIVGLLTSHKPILACVAQYLSLGDVIRFVSMCKELHSTWFLRPEVGDALGVREKLLRVMGWIVMPGQNPGLVWRRRTVDYDIEAKGLFWCSAGRDCGRVHRKEELVSSSYHPVPIGITCFLCKRTYLIAVYMACDNHYSRLCDVLCQRFGMTLSMLKRAYPEVISMEAVRARNYDDYPDIRQYPPPDSRYKDAYVPKNIVLKKVHEDVERLRLTRVEVESSSSDHAPSDDDL